MTNKPEWAVRFETLADFDIEYSEDIDANDKREWLKNNEHLFKDYTYPESKFELDKDKVKQFIATELQFQKEQLLQRIEEGLPKVMPGLKLGMHGAHETIGYNECIKQVLELLREEAS